MELRVLGPGDEERVVAAEHLLDGPADGNATRRFLQSDGHHLVIAYLDDHPVGFVTGVEMTHPDKSTEMFLYELGVDEQFRRQGIGRALVGHLRELAQQRVLRDVGGDRRVQPGGDRHLRERGGAAEGGQVVLDWTF